MQCRHYRLRTGAGKHGGSDPDLYPRLPVLGAFLLAYTTPTEAAAAEAAEASTPAGGRTGAGKHGGGDPDLYQLPPKPPPQATKLGESYS